MKDKGWLSHTVLDMLQLKSEVYIKSSWTYMLVLDLTDIDIDFFELFFFGRIIIVQHAYLIEKTSFKFSEINTESNIYIQHI